MNTKQPIRIMAVDDHPIVRAGIVSVIDTQPDMQVVAEAGDGAEAIRHFLEVRPDVVLMDLVMPGISGIEAIAQIRQHSATSKIIVLTTYRGDVQATRALQAGASSYLLKSMLRRELADAIRIVHAGQRYLPAEIAGEIAAHVGDEELSHREAQVLQCLARGLSNKIIAHQLHIMEGTVKAHMKSILSKLGARDRTHAVAIAVKRGIVDL
jgi:two-component system NarL family response regulator